MPEVSKPKTYGPTMARDAGDALSFLFFLNLFPSRGTLSKENHTEGMAEARRDLDSWNG